METFEISVKRFDEFASEYAERFMNINAYREYFDKFCELTPNKRPAILELGCGPGNVTRYLKHRFPDSEITAIDLAPRMIDFAKETVSGVDFRVMDVRHINTLNKQFDAVMCSFCLPFLSGIDASQLISDCSKQLVKGGILYISTMEGEASKAGFESTSFSGDSKVYFNYHLEKDLQKALMDNGFSIEFTTRQDYQEPDGTILIDLIIIARKK